ncbi:TPA: conjugal transfer protein [Enterococcus faecium]|uniref:conjugal transfer protein n=1 Tax=Enterococcus TaxID=1350 RepID=UPI000CF345D8|nr:MULTISPECIES: conjugal transfer protein [Enterococcus]EMF0340861.1 conjugal transfer protein [Enterococcus faecium]MDM4150839.1 conjugal transfer protein [Enterococcus faecalis]MDQ8370302.1 conjugal transfer protein [Enterococcus faecium]MDQ8493131.1 conjugal transfer protein [Enterococcus faecium]NSO55553.1 conjugal transfer protein [Enterococcus faecalis]
MFFKNTKEKVPKQKKIPTIKVGTHKKLTLALWLLLIGSVSFGIYKNFTAIDQHTIHEKEIIEQKIVDNNAIERYVENFAAVYFSWAPAQEAIDQRNNQLANYFTEELQQLNADTIRSDSPTISKVTKVQIWHLEQVSDTNDTKVTFSVEQQIIEGEKQSTVTSSYHVVVYTDKQDRLVIIQNPTMDATSSKSNYAPKKVESDETVDAVTTEEITEFLETFFTLYPKATESELAYYVSDNALPVINKDYVFVELTDSIYSKKGDQITATITVNYLDQTTKMSQFAQYYLSLKKDDNWKIIK